ncbi:acetyltransferase (GNAT) family protein [Cohnella sp. SGD-V74]|uniref:GNAT family N-acetyltransferase n=1 Tax=unclassified Cohnella TaxID=2636738 RepID=UPI000D40A602|nr:MULTISPECIES: N-acetyltransferase [unclassified Cohnella]PRX70830.1 acetyltransferase (GNAT) family protein [Cohnella sp. SGD-V74]
MKDSGAFEIVRADRAAVEVRDQMAEIFADGFSQWLTYFSKDRVVIAKAFAHTFRLEQFYVALAGDQVAAFGACTDCQSFSLELQSAPLRRHLGWFKGSIAALILKREFQKPFVNPPAETGSVEFIATALSFRGQGAASAVIRHMLEHLPYRNYLIEEVADTNVPAIRLYEKLGFTEYKRKSLSPRQARISGINHMVSLCWNRPELERRST